METKSTLGNTALPDYFRPLFWSWDFAQLDPEKHRKLIIGQTIKYGDLPHWQFLKQYYGKKSIQQVLSLFPKEEIRLSVKKLANLILVR